MTVRTLKDRHTNRKTNRQATDRKTERRRDRLINRELREITDHKSQNGRYLLIIAKSMP